LEKKRGYLLKTWLTKGREGESPLKKKDFPLKVWEKCGIRKGLLPVRKGRGEGGKILFIKKKKED